MFVNVCHLFFHHTHTVHQQYIDDTERESERAGITARIQVTSCESSEGHKRGEVLARQTGQGDSSFFPLPNYSDTVVQ